MNGYNYIMNSENFHLAHKSLFFRATRANGIVQQDLICRKVIILMFKNVKLKSQLLYLYNFPM